MPSHWNTSSYVTSRVLGQSRKISCPMPWSRTKSLQVEWLKTTTDGCSKSCQRQVLHWPKQKRKTQHWMGEWEVPRNGICFTECHQVLELTWHGEDTYQQSASFTWRQKLRVGHPHICCALWKLNENTGKMQSNWTLPEPATGLHVFMILVLKTQFGGIRAWGTSSICFNRFQHSMIPYLLFTIAIIRISNNSNASIFLEAVHVCLLHADV